MIWAYDLGALYRLYIGEMPGTRKSGSMNKDKIQDTNSLLYRAVLVAPAITDLDNPDTSLTRCSLS